MSTDGELLARYAHEGSESSFAELVRARAGFVHAAALRRANGNAHLAGDITQQVFIALARNARPLSRHTALSGWLYVTTRNIATQLIRAESRRQKREKESALMQATDTPVSSSADDLCLRENLDALLDALSERDRTALLWRFFEGRSLAEIARISGLTENAARMRVERALERLRFSFAKKGLASTAAVLSSHLIAQAGTELPATLLTNLTHTAVASAGVGATAWNVAFMSMTKFQTGLAITMVALGVGGVVFHQRSVNALEHEIAQLKAQAKITTDLPAKNFRVAQTIAATSSQEEPQNRRADTTEKIQRGNGVETAKPPATRKSVDLAPGLIPVENLAHSSRATARDAFSTQIWAAALGDVDLEQSSISLTPEARAKLETSLANLPESVRSNYGTPERLMASVLAGSPHPVGGMQILGEKSLGENSVVLETQWQHADDTLLHHSNVQLQRDDGGNWRLVVPMILVDRAIAYLNGNSVTQTMPKKN